MEWERLKFSEKEKSLTGNEKLQDMVIKVGREVALQAEVRKDHGGWEVGKVISIEVIQDGGRS